MLADMLASCVDTLWLGVIVVRESWGRSRMATIVVVTRRLGVGNAMLGLRVVAAAGGSSSDHIREKKQGYIKGVLASGYTFDPCMQLAWPIYWLRWQA